jgi:hypothetical protein
MQRFKSPGTAQKFLSIHAPSTIPSTSNTISRQPKRTARCGDDHVAHSGRGGLTFHEALTFRARRTGNVTKWTSKMRSPVFASCRGSPLTHVRSRMGITVTGLR